MKLNDDSRLCAYKLGATIRGMERPEVSVVMAVYNGDAALRGTLESVLAQEGCDFEVVVVDDGSSDACAKLLDQWAARERRLHVVHQENQGLTRALIRGCREARGAYIARQDAGDISLPGRLATQATMLREDDALGFVSCEHVLVGPGSEPLGSEREQASQRGLPGRDGAMLPGPAHGTVMFRKSMYDAVGGYRSEFYFAQDADLWSRLIEHSHFAYVPGVLYEMTFSLSGITARNRVEQEELRSIIEQCAAARRAGLSEADLLQRAAQIRPRPAERKAGERSRGAAAAYFVGSCLAQREDRRASKYLLQAVRLNPLHLKGWYKLLRLSLAGRA